MKNVLLSFIAVLLMTNCSQGDKQWKSLLVNGSLEGWHIFQDDGTKKGWVVEDSVLIFNGISDMESGKGDASLLSDAQYESFEIQFDWKVTPGGNSGFMWGVREDEIYKYPYQTGQEVQILDAAIYDDPDSALGGEIEIENAREDLEARKHFVGALYDLSAPSKDIEVNPANQWNSYHITIDYEENKGEVVLNGKLINSFPLRGPKWEEMVVESKFSKSDAEESVYLGEARWKGFGKYSKGHISFQDHPGLVAFKNIRIRELN